MKEGKEKGKDAGKEKSKDGKDKGENALKYNIAAWWNCNTFVSFPEDNYLWKCQVPMLWHDTQATISSKDLWSLNYPQLIQCCQWIN